MDNAQKILNKGLQNMTGIAVYFLVIIMITTLFCIIAKIKSIGGAVGILIFTFIMSMFSSGFYLLYKAGDLGYQYWQWYQNAIVVEGTVISADNNQNFAKATIQYQTPNQTRYEITYSASLNTTVFTVGEKIPVQYLSENPQKGEVREGNTPIKMLIIPFVPFFFFLITGLVLSSVFIILMRKFIQLIQQDRSHDKLPQHGIQMTVTIISFVKSNNGTFTLILQDGTDKTYPSKPLLVNAYDVDAMLNAQVILNILPNNSKIYDIDPVSLEPFRY